MKIQKSLFLNNGFLYLKKIKNITEMMWLAQDQTPSYKTINRF